MALTKATNSMITGAQINIKDFESLSSGGTDWQPAIQAAIDSLDTGSDYTTGGVIYFPVGRYYIKSPIVVRTSGAANLASITLQGEGLHNTIIDCADGFSGDQAIQALDPTYCAFKDFQVLGNNRTSYGLELEGGGPLPAGSEILVERVFCQNFTASCFYVHRCFMITMTQCRSKGGVTGFDFSGDYNTSLNVSNCYALSTNAAGQGFLIDNVAYSNFTACGADNTGRYGYRVRNTMGVTFDSCGAEQAVRSSWYFEASAALDSGKFLHGVRCTLNGCVSVGADAAGGYGSIYSNQVDTSSIDVEINRLTEFSVDGPYSVASAGVDTDHKVSLNGCKLTGSIVSTVAVVDPVDVTRVNNKAVTSANTPIVDLASIFGSVNNYSGVLNILASNGVPTGGSPYNSASYVLLVTKSTGGSGIVEIAKNGLTAGGGGSHPSFTWTLDTANNQLEATPVGSTSGNFYFYIGQLGTLSPS
tara:strand:- start:1976 stop:3397 length:1422 start_codon:yes stop_codon:yes gene_type:complete